MTVTPLTINTAAPPPTIAQLGTSRPKGGNCSNLSVMVYRRRNIRPLRRNLRYVKRTSSTRSRFSAKSRYRKPRSSKRGIGRKAILNITSRKKQDNMRSMLTTPFGVETTPGGIIMTGDNDYTFIWMATARDNVISGVEPGVFQQSQRTATSCYMRGLKERWTMETGSPAMWRHRRILFSFQGDALYRVDNDAILDGDNQLGAYFKELSNGYVRAFTRLEPQTGDYRQPELSLQLRKILFKGTEGNDWVGVLNAKVDTLRVKVLYDKTTTIRSANDRGVITGRKFWHNFNSTLVYDDDENGNSTANSPFSVQDRRSMGDVYVVDFFQSGLGSTSSDELRLNAEATLYWHER